MKICTSILIQLSIINCQSSLNFSTKKGDNSVLSTTASTMIVYKPITSTAQKERHQFCFFLGVLSNDTLESVSTRRSCCRGTKL